MPTGLLSTELKLPLLGRAICTWRHLATVAPSIRKWPGTSIDLLLIILIILYYYDYILDALPHFTINLV